MATVLDALSPSSSVMRPALPARNASADLAAHLGPVAAIVVRSAAKKALDLSALVNTLANDIADPVARTDFVRKHLSHERRQAAPEALAPQAAGRRLPDGRSGPPNERSLPAHTRSLPTGLYPPPPPSQSRPVFEASTLARAEAELAQ